MLLATSSPGESGSSGRIRAGIVFFTKEVHCWICHGGMKLCSREDLHLEPPPSQGGMQGSYTSGADENYVMPVLPRPVRFGRSPCALIHQ